MDKIVDDVYPTSLASQEDNEPVSCGSCIGTSDVQSQTQTSSQGASCVDDTEHSREPHKAKPYLGDCQVVPRPDADSRWMFPPPVPGGEYDSYNTVGGSTDNTQLNAQLSGHVGHLTGAPSNFTSSSAFNSSNYNSLRSDFALGAREPYLLVYRQVDFGLNTSVPGGQRLHSNSAWKANSRQTSVGNMAHADEGSSGLPAPPIAIRSNGADNRHVSEAESRRTSQYALGTERSNVLNTCGDRVVSGANRDVDNTHTAAALLSAGSRGTWLVASGNEHSSHKPHGAEASLISNTGGSMLNRDFRADSGESTDNSLLALEQHVKEACALAPARESPLWQCDHFKRRCSVRFPCCGVFYPCHRCHNGSGVCDSSNKKANQATHIKCTNCGHKGEINEGSQICNSCCTKMAEYFCFKCKHFTGVDKNPFHCDKCGICRIHRDRAFHCDVCNVCLDKRLEEKHKCQPFSQQEKRHICLQENQGKEGVLLEDQGALQTESIEDAVPSNNESTPQSESMCNEEDLSATVSDDAVLGLMATVAPECQMQKDHLENVVQERKKEHKTLQALLEKVSSRDDMTCLPGMHAVCDDSSTPLSVPAYRHSNTGVVTQVPLELPSLVDEVEGIDAIFLTRHSQDLDLCESPQANVPEARPNMVSSSEPSLVNKVQGIDTIFLARHSRDLDLCESPQANVETTSLLEAGPNMVSYSEPSLVNEVQEIDAIFLARHSRDPDLCKSPQANVETTSLLEAGPNMFSSLEDSVLRQGIQNSCLVPTENDCVFCKNDGSQACSRVYGPIMRERCRPESGHGDCCECLEVSSSEDPVSRQWIRNACLIPSENECVCCENDGSQACSRVYGPIMPERCRPDSGHGDCCECLEVSSSEDPVSRRWIRNACLVPSENECVCCENDRSQACGVYGTVMPERCRPDSDHDESWRLNCPICGRAFLWRG